MNDDLNDIRTQFTLKEDFPLSYRKFRKSEQGAGPGLSKEVLIPFYGSGPYEVTGHPKPISRIVPKKSSHGKS